MGDKDWADAWERGDIGFHQSTTNDFLRRFGPLVWGMNPGRVLVPLCGKSLDMVHLAETANAVVGVEFVEQAVQEFFAERELTAVVTSTPPKTYTAGPYTLFAADFFSVAADHTGTIDSVFDRASIVALDGETRARYADHLASLLPTNATVLLITFDYNQSFMAGPPFAVPDDEVHRLFDEMFEIELLDTVNALNDEMRARGATKFDSSAYKMVKR